MQGLMILRTSNVLLQEKNQRPDIGDIRLRLRDHLESLRKRFPNLLDQAEIRETPEADHAYRLFLPKSVWTRIVADLVEETDYENFKSEVRRHQGPDEAAYEQSLHRVWDVMYGLQNRGRR